MDTETALNLCPFSQRGPLQTPSTLVIPALTTSQASAELCPFPFPPASVPPCGHSVPSLPPALPASVEHTSLLELFQGSQCEATHRGRTCRAKVFSVLSGVTRHLLISPGKKSHNDGEEKLG